MKFPRSLFIATLGALMLPVIGLSESLRSVGVLGNSGEQGETLVRFGDETASGLAVIKDRFGSLWDRGGAGVLNRYTVDGRLVASYQIAPTTSRNDRDTMVLLGDTILLKLGRKLYTLPVTAPSGERAVELPVGATGLSFSSHDGWAAAVRDNVVFWVNAAGETRDIVTLDSNAAEVEVGPDAGVYVMRNSQFMRVDSGVTDDERGPFNIPGDRSQWLSGHWYGKSWHGTIRRFDRDLNPAPGVVLGGASGSFIGYVEGNHELGSGCGMAHLRGDLFAVSGAEGVMHLLDWSASDQRFLIVRRIGALAACKGLAIDSKGRVWSDNNVWDWSDGAAAPVHNSGPGAEVYFGVSMLDNDVLVAPAIRWGKPVIYGGGMNAPSRIFDGVDELNKKLTASAVVEINKERTLVVVDAEGRGLSYSVGWDGRPTGKPGVPVTLQATTPIKTLTSLAALDSGKLAAAADGQIIEFSKNGDSWTETRRWRSWGKGDESHFGDEITLTTSSNRIWVSDTKRHRVLGFDFTGKLFSAFGRLDKPGSGLDALNAPTTLAASGDRVVVYDSGNQRLVKLERVD